MKKLKFVQNKVGGRLQSKRMRISLGVFAMLIIILSIGLYITRTQALTGFVYPDGDVTRGFAGAPSGCTATAHYNCINDATNVTSDFARTGIGGTTGEVEEFTMTSVAASGTTVRQVVVIVGAHSDSCVGNGTNCDTLTVNISIDGSYQTAETYTPTATNSETGFTFSGSWSDDIDLQVQLIRTRVGGGNASAADDDILLTNIRAEVTYSNNNTFQQASYRWFNNSTTLTSSDTFTKLSNPPTKPTGLGQGTAWSSDGNYMAVSHHTSPYLTIYKRSGDSFIKLADPATLPSATGAVYTTAWSADGTYLVVTTDVSPFVYIYKRSGDTFTKLSNPSTLPSGAVGASFSPDGTYLALGESSNGFLAIYKRSGDTFTLLGDPATLPTGIGWATAWSPDGQFLTVAHVTTPFVTIYQRSGDTFTKLSDPGSLPAGNGNSTAWSPDGTYLSVGHSTTPFITIYKRSGTTFTKLSDPGSLPAGFGSGTAWSPDGQYMSVSHSTTPFITIYKRSGDTFTKLTDPATLPPALGNDTAWSPDGQYMSVAHDTTPFITIYKNPVSIDVDSTLAAQDTAATAPADGTPFRLRMNLKVGGGAVGVDDASFSLQYAARGSDNSCDTSFTDESYSAVLTDGGAIRYYDNTQGVDGLGVTTNANDPTVSGSTLTRQTYQESNDFTVTNQVASGDAGMWDFALTAQYAPGSTTYCFRTVRSSGTAIDTYTVVPQITTPGSAQSQSSYRLFANSDPSTIEQFERLSDPSTLPTNHSKGTSWSPDGTYMSLAFFNSPYFSVYKRTGDTFTKLTDPSTLPPLSSTGTAWSPDGTYLSVSHAGSPYVTIYKRSGDTFTKLTNPASLPTGNANGVGWSPDGQYMSVAHNTSPYVTIYKRSGDTFTKLTDPSNLPAGQGNTTAWSPNGLYMTIAHSTTPFITIYKRAGDTFTKLSDPGTLPPDYSIGASWSPDSTYMSVAHTSSPFITIYKRSGDTFTKLADPADLPPTSSSDTTWSHNGQYLSVANGGSPYIITYRRSGDTFTKLADPATPLAGTGNSSAWSPDGVHLVVGHNTSPYMSIYKTDIFSAVGSALAAQDTAATAPAQGTKFRLRMGVHVEDAMLDAGSFTYKLQFAQKSGTCDTSFSGESYSDVATGSGAIRFSSNTYTVKGLTPSDDANNPVHSGHTVVRQQYSDSNNFSTSYDTPFGQDALWDFSLVDFSAPGGTSYCFRMISSGGSELDSYSVIPQITTEGSSNAAPSAPTLSSPAGGATGVSVLPTLQLRSSDADNDYLRYMIQICSNSDCSSVVRTVCQETSTSPSCTGSQTGWSGQNQQSNTAYTGNSTLASSTMASHTYQAAALSYSTQYWWRAYAIDPGGSNSWSSVSIIASFTTGAAPTGGGVGIGSGTTIKSGTKIGN